MGIFKSKSGNRFASSSRTTDTGNKHIEHAYSESDALIPAPVRIYNAGGFQDFVQNLITGETRILDRTLSRMIPYFNKIDTIQSFMETIKNSKWQGDDESIRNGINEFILYGFLLNKKELIEDIIKKEKNIIRTPGIQISSWVTRNRTQQLRQSIESFVENNRHYDRHPAYMVCDDSPETQVQKNTQAMLGSLAGDLRIQIAYIGEGGKRGLCEKILEAGKGSGLPKHVLEFALFDSENCGSSYGANRNAALLATAGEIIMSTDDDILCRTAVLFEQSPELRIKSQAEIDETRIYPDRETLLNEVSFRDNDLLACHETMLGNSLAECIVKNAESSEDVIIENISTRLLSMIAKTDGRVMTTLGGTCGDSGHTAAYFTYYFKGPSLERILASESAYKTAQSSREMVQCHSHPTISEGNFYASMNIGLDNREILPPFFPVFRGEDTIFSQIIQIINGNALVGYLPHAIFHDTREQRSYPPGASYKCSMSVANAICMLLEGYFSRTTCYNIADEFKALGSHFIKTGSLSDDDFDDYVKKLWLTRAGHKIGIMENKLHGESNIKNAYLRSADIERYIEEIRKLAVSTNISLPDDLPEHVGHNEAISFFRGLLRKYGELLTWWPEIISAAKEVRNNYGGEIFKI